MNAPRRLSWDEPAPPDLLDTLLYDPDEDGREDGPDEVPAAAGPS